MKEHKIQIIYEDTHVIVCVKPGGVPTQTKKIGCPDMVSILKNHIREQGVNDPYLGVVHRLDQPVCGVMVFAKSKKAAKELSRQLNESGFGKYYRALVEKTPEKPEGTLENYMVKDGKTNTSRLCSKDTKDSKIARLRYKIINEDTKMFTKEDYSDSKCVEIAIKLDTGRHHQIRVQMAGMGCPIVGDRKYNPNGKYSKSLCLCAYCLSFTHPVTNKQLSFSLI